jgi:hypothetical protein
MPAKLISFAPKPPRGKTKKPPREKPPVPLTMPAICSFLKDTRGMVTWTPSHLAKTLGANLAQVSDALPLLAMQGYIKAAGGHQWMTTIAGESLSGSVTPRLQPEAVERALAALKERIRALNKDAAAEFTVARAVAFGDFLEPAPRVQAADVGLQLKRRNGDGSPVADRRSEEALFSALRARSSSFRLVRFEDWMSTRTRRKLL